MDNYRGGFAEEYRKFLQLAPKNLNQTINPWSFSLVQFTREIKGDPAVEYKILTEVAGYGSQLGTILDFLGVLEKACQLDSKKLKDPKQVESVDRFHTLARAVNHAKKT